MAVSSREEVVAVFDALRDAVSGLAELSFDSLTTPERLGLLERLEHDCRRLPVARHALINGVRQQAGPAEIGGKLSHVLADRLGITGSEANRRIDDAADLGQRQALTGEPLPARLAATAAAQRRGLLGAGHVRVIRGFLRDLPCWIDTDTRERAEAQLAQFATQYRPEVLATLAAKLAEVLNPDGEFSDADRARRRGLTLGTQDRDGMTALRGWLTPAARAALEAVLAKLAAPGMANPHDPHPVLDGAPTPEAIQRDTRSPAQRNHDALHTAARALLACGKLGQHNGLPASIIVTTTLRELQAQAGTALTGGGTVLPMSEVIAMARHANHYLAIFDNGKPIGLYHTKRLATPGQRIVLYAKDRGCTHPGCDVPGYLCDVHHIREWTQNGRTDIDNLTFACRSHHRLIKPGGWTTRQRPDGRTDWIPPPHLDRGQPRTNIVHHPEKLLESDDGGG
jgi:hypothetical protein